MKEEPALGLARMMLYENPRDLYGLREKSLENATYD